MSSSEDVNSFARDDLRNGCFNVDSSDFETQKIDSQCLGCDLNGNEINNFQYLKTTMPVEGICQFEDAFETQNADPYGETQVVDLVDEIHVLDDLGCLKNLPMEFLDEFNSKVVNSCEDANKSEAFYETQVLPQDEFEKIDNVDSVGLENIVDTPAQEAFSGGFTSIRAASLRASGLSAFEHGSKRDSFPSSCDNSSREQKACKIANLSSAECSLEPGMKNNHEGYQNECMGDIEAHRNPNKCKVASLTIRKLFKDGEFAEADQSEHNVINQQDDNIGIYSENNCLAGLSYANSQEPGELSQAHALEVVDRFLDLHVVDLDEGVGSTYKNDKKKTRIASGAEGSRELAKKSSSIIKVDGQHGIYDWDDNREDDGGGDFFLKKKEIFFGDEGGKKRCFTNPRNPNEVEKKNFTKSKLKGKQFSCGKKIMAQKYPMKDMDDEHLNVVEVVPKLAENEKNKNATEMKDVGPDTQIAVEAIETLCFEVHFSKDNGVTYDPDTDKATRKKLSSNIITTRSEECSTGKRLHHPSVGVVNQQANQTKRTRSSIKPPFLPKAVDTTVVSNLEMKSADQKSMKTSHFDHLDFSVPVVHRTKKRAELASSKAGAKSYVTRNELNHLVSAARKRAASKDKIAEMVGIENGKNSGLNRFGASNIDATDNLPEGRSWKENLAVHQADKQRNNWKSKRLRKVGYYSSLAMGSAKTCYDEIGENRSSKHDATQNAISGLKVAEINNEKSDVAMPLDTGEADDKVGASSPIVCRIPTNNVSPICMGDEYHTQSRRKNLETMSLIKEFNKSAIASPGLCSGMKESRKRKSITNVRVLFSQHMDEDILKKQKKILTKLGGAVATLISDASHFVADEFVRTRNMLEAIAFGKPVVTHLWLESCGQASCLIDERNYILRDSRKEREFGFCLPSSLSKACQHPLLQGQKVLVTPNTKPGKDVLVNLVKVVHGLVIERVGRSMLKDEKFPEDVLILSCEEDYDLCVPFLEKGGSVYSSELLLNGIVKQKLEYERHSLFADNVRRTRSSIWMKKKNGYCPVKKCK